MCLSHSKNIAGSLGDTDLGIAMGEKEARVSTQHQATGEWDSSLLLSPQQLYDSWGSIVSQRWHLPSFSPVTSPNSLLSY